MAVNSQSEKSHVQILHYTSDDKHSIVLSHISCIATLNVKIYDFCERPAGKRTNGRMSVRRLIQNILSIWSLQMIYIMIIYWQKATLPHPIWFFRFENAPNPPPPPFGGGMVEVCSREAAAFKNNWAPPMLLFNSIFFIELSFFITYCKEYQLFTQTTNSIIIANVKTLDRFYCKERERYLRTFSLHFRLGNSNSFF